MLLQSINRYSKPIAFFYLLLFYAETVLANRFGHDSLNSGRSMWPASARKVSSQTGWFKPAMNVATNDVPIFHNLKGIQNEGKKVGNQNNENYPERALWTSDRVGGPDQPEMQAFQSVNGNNMVDLFSGDFSYNVPLLDVGGYPIGLSYRSGISMDQEASWVGLGWSVNPGTITRNMRGLPDDFDGKNDSIKKVTSIRENKTIGVTAGANVEVVGFPLGGGASLGIFHNNYKGWGIEQSVNASITAGNPSKGTLTGGLSVSNNSQEGLTLNPSLSVALAQRDADEKSGMNNSFSVGLPYNSRSGLKALQLSTGIHRTKQDEQNQRFQAGGSISSFISFASPSYTPSISIPYSSSQLTFTGKVGTEFGVVHPNFFLSGYVSRQGIRAVDTALSLPSYGYIHYSDGVNKGGALLDFNREKDIPYREKPAVPHIAVPMYTYDAFSITGEGTGGMFRPYRGDIGFVYDHTMRTKDESFALSVDVGPGNLAHLGLDLNVNRAFSQTGPWLGGNALANTIPFQQNNAAYEGVYFRNPGEKAINSKTFYEAIGGDDLVSVQLYQPGNSSSSIQATNYLTRYRNKRAVGNILLTRENSIKQERDKRTQVISYLTAKEASMVGLSKYIENYTPNQFGFSACSPELENLTNAGSGLTAEYFSNKDLAGSPQYRTINNTVDFDWNTGPPPIANFPSDKFSVRWQGSVKAPETGTYEFTTVSDDGVRLWLNDSLLVNEWNDHSHSDHSRTVNLIKDELYKIRLEYYENKGYSEIRLQWKKPGQTQRGAIPQQYLSIPDNRDTFKINGYVVKEKRVNAFRKENHISEIDVLNTDGRRYVYGIPVYNLRQKEATFSVNGFQANRSTGLVAYEHGKDNSASQNRWGKDRYYNSEEIPGYAHSFLLTGIVSADYIDLSGNGISEDDIGEAIKFNYSKMAGIANPYRWRIPYASRSDNHPDSATFNEGLHTDYRDDKGSYVYGEKELWYLHSIESKTMVATFTTEGRHDLLAIDEAGHKYQDGSARRLKEINLYNKADLQKHGLASIPIKTVHFDYTYELCRGINHPLNDSGKLTLKRIWFTYNGNDKGKQNPYVFNYNTKNPRYNAKSFDRWGNFKDPLENPGSTSTNLIQNAEYPYSLKDSALAAGNAAAWALDSVFLPSGGALKVQYESDDYAFVQNRRAMEMCKIAGLGSSPTFSSATNQLYAGSGDNRYVFIALPKATTSENFYSEYLSGIKKLYFKLRVKMPADDYGNGYEYVPCYADLEQYGAYGMVNPNLIWVKIAGISLAGDGTGSYSPLAKAAIQFLRQNLPSKAYPGSEVGDDIGGAAAIKIIFAQATNITNAFRSFDKIARSGRWAYEIDTSRSFVRLNSPDLKKYGGGHRVKRITIYDNWDKMTGQRAATYGREYIYRKTQLIDGKEKTISSGVASYEPNIGNEENPFHQPLEYVEKISALGPVTLGYSEEPLGESLFPAAGVGYSIVRTRTINYKNVRSANGYDETAFYTAYDFPTVTDHSLIDGDTKKRYRPALANFLRINAKHYLGISQGFKVELNDMHGKLRWEASYGETNPNSPVSYTENVYRVEGGVNSSRLSNKVMAMRPDGSIDGDAVIGKDVELMVDMREQLSVTNGNNISVNTDMFAVPFIPPFFVIPSLLNLAQREENKFQSIATLKVVQRYGILDSVIRIDKGSKISTKNLVYDSETGEPLLTQTQNEFNDPVYTFNYPAHWAYDGMGLAYKNIDVVLKHITIKDGRIIDGLGVPDSTFFSNGDEILVAGKQKTGNGVSACVDDVSTFPAFNKIWALDSSVNGGGKHIYFIDRNGEPYGGSDISLKIIRSGRRNVQASVGSVTTLKNPVSRNPTTQQFVFQVDSTSKVLNAGSMEFENYWHRTTYCTSCSATNGSCPLDSVPPIIDSATICLVRSQDSSYGSCGTYLYSSYWPGYTPFRRSQMSPSNPFWSPTPGNKSSFCNYTPVDTMYNPAARIMDLSPDSSSTSASRFSTPSSRDSILSPLNRCGVWLCPAGSDTPYNKWVGFSTRLDIPVSKTYYIGMGGDNRIQAFLDGGLFKEDDTTRYGKNHVINGENYRIWHIYPVYLTAGNHTLKVQGYNTEGNASFGLEVYGNSETTIRNARSYADLDSLVFSTKDLVGTIHPSGISCPAGFALDTINGHYVCRSYQSKVTYKNPLSIGIFGNWRPKRSYVYYSARAESDPATVTNIRVNGAFANYHPFWAFAGNHLQPAYDTTRWVWNSEITEYNRKGMEIENKDPLGRYNSGQYGYDLTLPVSVVQNSKVRESGYEGFEDYGYNLQKCDTACKDIRHLDFTPYAYKITTAQRHTGKSSLQLNPSEVVSIAVALTDSLLERAKPKLVFDTKTISCASGNTLLSGISYANDNMTSKFSPSKGSKMVISAWVKEAQACTGPAYTGNRITIAFQGTSVTYPFSPAGPVIEGWQRYEGVFTIPAGATGMSLLLESFANTTTYFDDIRLHPFNANMKSFVYNNTDLRLMADLDENAYATFYEYDDDGTLIRVKKETERGIKTIKETRSALVKQ